MTSLNYERRYGEPPPIQFGIGYEEKQREREREERHNRVVLKFKG